jgi:methionyl-tRNA formyltransferase
MRIVFFGTSSFSASLLETLSYLDHEIVGVVTRPDRPQGRSLRLRPSPVKEFSLKHHPSVPLFQPEKASTEGFCEELKALKADLFLVVAYGEILKQNILSIPFKACVNVHTSLLPKYRGASPMQGCLMQGDNVSGVTFMEMALKMDAGDVLKQEFVDVPLNMNVRQLEESLLAAAQKGLPDLLSRFDFYYESRKKQAEDKATFVSKITPDDCQLDWSKSVEELHNRVRALSPTPGVFVNLRFGSEVKRLKILESYPENASSEGEGVISLGKNSMKISCQNGFLSVLKVQLEGKKAMSIGDFLRGSSGSFSLSL